MPGHVVRNIRLVGLGLLFAIVVAPPGMAWAEEELTGGIEDMGTVSAPASRVHVDPATGRIVSPPRRPAEPGVAPPPVSPWLENALSTSDEGLVEKPGRSRAGGVAVDLRGRFRSATTATVGTDGTAVRQCTSGIPIPTAGGNGH